MSENLNPTGLGTIIQREYAEADIAHRRQSARGPLSYFEIIAISVVTIGAVYALGAIFFATLT